MLLKHPVLKCVSSGALPDSSSWLHGPAVVARLYAGLAEGASRRQMFLHLLEARKRLLQS